MIRAKTNSLLVKFSLTLAMTVSIVVATFVGDAFAQPPDEHADETHKPATVSLVFESSHTALPTGASEFFLRARLKAAKSTSDAREPLNLSVVFDRSGSMKEEAKIGYLRQAGHLVADNLTRDDHVAFVAYNDQVQVLVPMHPVVNREYLHHRIDELYADGHTNLSGGILEGCAQLDKRLDKPGLHHAILLTDGLANRGVIDTPSLVRLAKKCAARGITLTTIGVGTQYNEDLLSQLALAGNGRYVYVSEPDKIPTAFEQELGSLTAIVAQNATLRMPVPTQFEAIQVFGREEPIEPGVLEISLTRRQFIVGVGIRFVRPPGTRHDRQGRQSTDIRSCLGNQIDRHRSTGIHPCIPLHPSAGTQSFPGKPFRCHGGHVANVAIHAATVFQRWQNLVPSFCSSRPVAGRPRITRRIIPTATRRRDSICRPLFASCCGIARGISICMRTSIHEPLEGSPTKEPTVTRYVELIPAATDD